MSDCRLLVRLPDETPMKLLSISLKDRSDAFMVAQRFDVPVELWEGDKNVCTISRAPAGDFWIITDGAQV